jgi:cysteine desulfuration protein SufE
MDEHDLSIAEAEQSYIDDLNTLEDWFLQYEYLLRISADLPRIPAERRTEEKRVRGCQSGVWLELEYAGGRVLVRADSEALIIRGILSIAVYLLNGRTPEEIAAYAPRYIRETNIKKQISTDRFKGLSSVIDTIKAFAAAQM